MNDKDNLIVFINEHIKSGSEKLRFFNLLDKYTNSLQLRKADVMARCFKNYKGQYFIYKSKITKAETKFKVARNFESQGRTVLVSENDNKYYLNEVIPYNEP